MVTVSNKNSEGKEEKKSRGVSIHSANGHGSCSLEDVEKEGGESTMRVGKAYQAEIPSLLKPKDLCPATCPERALLVWSPKNETKEEELEQYIWLAKDKFGYNAEQALGMLFWHRHDVVKATADLANFTPFPDEWTLEDKVLFEQAFQFHGKNFHRIRHMLPDKTVPQLVKYYYLWKKTRQRTSLIDRHARRHLAKAQGENAGENGADKSDDESESRPGGEDTKMCVNCSIPATVLMDSPKGPQCQTCYNHWKRVGSLRPTVGPMKRDKQLIKHKRNPPRGMYINHENLMAMVATSSSGASHGIQLLKHMDNEIVALKRQVQSSKAQISSLRENVNKESISHLRPTAPSGPQKAKWSQEELLLAVQAVRYFGKDFKAVAEIIGNKTENHVRSFFVTYRKRYNLDNVLKEWEEEHGPPVPMEEGD